MSTMEEARLRDMYDALCEALDKVADALHANGTTNEQLIERAREMTQRAFRAEGERDSAKRLVEIARDHHDREARELRRELADAQHKLMCVTAERDSLRRDREMERRYRDERSAQLLREIKEITAGVRGEK